MNKERRKKLMLIMLDILKSGDIHGYGIAEKIEKKYGVERPSSGVIYPTLSTMLRKKYVEIKEHGRRDKKIYGITPEGKRYLEEHRDEVEEAKAVLRNLGVFREMGGYRLIKKCELLIKNLHYINGEKKNELEKLLSETEKKIDEILRDVDERKA